MILENTINSPLITYDLISNIKNGNDITNRKEIFQSLRSISNINFDVKCVTYDFINFSINFIQTPLYYYQQQNIKWLDSIERNITHKHNNIDYYNSDIVSCNKLYLDIDKERFYIHKPDYNTLNYYGGVLLDENFLGKTLCFIALALLDYKKDDTKKIEYIYNSKAKIYIKTQATLILCSNHLCYHWQNEIKKHVNNNIDLNIIIISTKNQYEKIKYNDIFEADFVIISINFFDNIVYKNLIKSYQNNYQNYQTIFENINYEFLNNGNINLQKSGISFHMFSWKRIIIDEFNNAIKKFDIISLLHSKYRWSIINKLYFKTYYDKCMNFIFNTTYDNYTPQILSFFIKKLCRYNTYESIKKEFQLSNHKDEVVWLNFTLSEKYIYNYCENIYDKNTLMQFCSHPQIKNFIKHCRTLSDINTYLIKLNNEHINEYQNHYQMIKDDISKLNKNHQKLKDLGDIDEIKSQIENKISLLENKYKKINKHIDYHKKNISYLENFKINNCNQCPICLYDIDKAAVTHCGHIFCNECMSITELKIEKCPICRAPIKKNDIMYLIDSNINIHEDGTKLSYLINYVKKCKQSDKIIILTKWDDIAYKIHQLFGNNSIKAYIYKGGVNQKKKIINDFTNLNNNILIINQESYLSMVNTSIINYLILLDPEYKNENIITHWYNKQKNKNIKVMRFLIKNTIEENIYKKYTSLNN